MTVYIRRNGKLVDVATLKRQPVEKPAFPTPRISRFETYASPIDGHDVSSWRQRDREMQEHDCYDPRDLAPDHHFRRGREVQLRELEEVRANERSED